MTKENAKILYNSFVEKGMIAEAENVLIRHPEFKEAKEEIVETKSKGKK